MEWPVFIIIIIIIIDVIVVVALAVVFSWKRGFNAETLFWSYILLIHFL